MPEPFDGDPYVTLRVSPTASASEIRRAFHRLAKQHHPDVDGSAGAVAEMAHINAAYEILSDRARRVAWDDAHRPGAPRPTGPTAPRSAGARGRPGRPPGGPAGAAAQDAGGPRGRGPTTATGTRPATRGAAAGGASAGATTAGAPPRGTGGPVPHGPTMGARPGGAPPAPPVTAREWRRRTAGRRRGWWLVAVGGGAIAVVGAIVMGWWIGLGQDRGVAVVDATTAPGSPSPADPPTITYQALTYDLRTTGSPRVARDSGMRLRGTGDDDGTYCEITRDADGRIASAWIVLAGTSRETPVTVSVNDADGDEANGLASALLTAGAGPKRREYAWDPDRAIGSGSFLWSPEGTMAFEATLVTSGGSELGVLASFSCGAIDPPR